MKFVFRFRVMLTILVVAFLMAAAFCVNNYYDSKRLLTENYILNLEDKLSLQADRFDAMMQQMYQQVLHISKQEQLEQLVADCRRGTPSNLSQAAYSERLAGMQSADGGQFELFLYVPEMQQVISSVAYRSNADVSEEELAALVHRDDLQPLTPTYLENPLLQSAQYVFCYAVPIEDTAGEPIALLCIMLDERMLYYDLLSPLNTAAQDHYRLISPQGRIHSAASAAELGQKFEAFDTMQGKKMNADEQQGNQLTISVAAPLSQYYLVCQSDLGTVAQGLQEILLSQVVRLFVAFCILFFLSIILSHWLAKPLRELAQAMEAVGSGDFTTRVQQPKADEFSALHMHFNNLISRLDELTDQVVVERMQKSRPNSMPCNIKSARILCIIRSIPSGLPPCCSEIKSWPICWEILLRCLNPVCSATVLSSCCTRKSNWCAAMFRCKAFGMWTVFRSNMRLHRKRRHAMFRVCFCSRRWRMRFFMESIRAARTISFVLQLRSWRINWKLPCRTTAADLTPARAWTIPPKTVAA